MADIQNYLFIKYKDEYQKSKWTIECRIFISFIWSRSELWNRNNNNVFTKKRKLAWLDFVDYTFVQWEFFGRIQKLLRAMYDASSSPSRWRFTKAREIRLVNMQTSSFHAIWKQSCTLEYIFHSSKELRNVKDFLKGKEKNEKLSFTKY